MPLTVKSFQQFDRKIISSRWDKMNRGPLSRAGLRVRQVAIRSIRKRKPIPKGSKRKEKPSPAGEPPRSRAPGHPLRLIFSVPNRLGTSVIVGPVGLTSDVTTTPEAHEFGKPAVRTVFVKEPFQRRSSKGRFRKKRRLAQKKVIRFKERAFMRPALLKVRSQLPDLWKNSLR